MVKPIRWSLSLACILSAASAVSQDSAAAWRRAWEEAAASGPYAPSPVARAMAEAEFGDLSDAAHSAASYAGFDERFRLAFAAALQAERALRFGATAQEARAELRQRLRLHTERGETDGERIAGKLRKAENAPSSGSGGSKAFGRSESGGPAPGKGGSGR